jgi:hypothetical protein
VYFAAQRLVQVIFTAENREKFEKTQKRITLL